MARTDVLVEKQSGDPLAPVPALNGTYFIPRINIHETVEVVESQVMCIARLINELLDSPRAHESQGPD
jgi:hypothetical protein